MVRAAASEEYPYFLSAGGIAGARWPWRCVAFTFARTSIVIASATTANMRAATRLCSSLPVRAAKNYFPSSGLKYRAPLNRVGKEAGGGRGLIFVLFPAARIFGEIKLPPFRT